MKAPSDPEASNSNISSLQPLVIEALMSAFRVTGSVPTNLGPTICQIIRKRTVIANKLTNQSTISSFLSAVILLLTFPSIPVTPSAKMNPPSSGTAGRALVSPTIKFNQKIQ